MRNYYMNYSLEKTEMIVYIYCVKLYSLGVRDWLCIFLVTQTLQFLLKEKVDVRVI